MIDGERDWRRTRDGCARFEGEAPYRRTADVLTVADEIASPPTGQWSASGRYELRLAP